MSTRIIMGVYSPFLTSRENVRIQATMLTEETATPIIDMALWKITMTALEEVAMGLFAVMERRVAMMALVDVMIVAVIKAMVTTILLQRCIEAMLDLQICHLTLAYLRRKVPRMCQVKCLRATP